jgi:transcriptional regulator with XRE-family HTH domain
VIYAREIRDEMERLGLSRREMGKRLGVSADRITQWLCLLKLREEKLREIEVLGDYWERQTVTERMLRKLRGNIE